LNLPGYVGFFQFLRNFCQQNAFEQAELILRAALDHAIARRAKKESLSRALITLIFYKLRYIEHSRSATPTPLTWDEGGLL
jgi:hypothetical protein